MCYVSLEDYWAVKNRIMISCGKNILLVCAFVMVSILAVSIYYYYNPTSSHWFPHCPIKQLTGWSCPACGFQRATHSLLHGKFEEALSYNYFYVIGLPYFALITFSYGLKKANTAIKLSELFEHKIWAMVYVCCFFVWFVLRNIFDI